MSDGAVHLDAPAVGKGTRRAGQIERLVQDSPAGLSVVRSLETVELDRSAFGLLPFGQAHLGVQASLAKVGRPPVRQAEQPVDRIEAVKGSGLQQKHSHHEASVHKSAVNTPFPSTR